MKNIVISLLLLCAAPSLDAQERILLHIDTAYSNLADIWNMEAANDGENGLCMQQRSASVGTAYNLFNLPAEKLAEGVMPDSIVYVMKADVQFELWSIASTHRWFWDIGCAEPADSLRHVSVPFATGGRDDMRYVGVGLVGCDWRPSKGLLWIDAVYAVYNPTAPIDTASTEDSTMNVDDLPGIYPTDDGPLAHMLDVQEHTWYDATGRVVDHATRPAFLVRDHAAGVYFATRGSYVWRFVHVR